MLFPYSLSPQTFTVIVNGQPYSTDKTNPNWPQIVEKINDPETTPEEMIGLINPITAVTNALSGLPEVNVRGGCVFYGEEQLHGVLAERLLQVMGEWGDITPWVKFIQNVYANPWEQSREELYLFLESADLPLTEDGCFLAYKMVKSDYTDQHTGTFDNSPGRVVVMPGGRDKVDPNRHRTCSYGLHFCSKGYLPSTLVTDGPTRVVIVKINPADVVAIPDDYENAKGRTWRYEVIGEIPAGEANTRKWKAVEVDIDGVGWDEQPDPDDYDDEPEESDFDSSWKLPESGTEGLNDLSNPPLKFGDIRDYPGMTGFVIKEADPELEKLLAEEEARELELMANDPAVKAAHDAIAGKFAPKPGGTTEAEVNAKLSATANAMLVAAVKAGAPETAVEVEGYGPVNKQKFLDLLSKHGTLSGIAKALGKSRGTVQGWQKKLIG